MTGKLGLTAVGLLLAGCAEDLSHSGATVRAALEAQQLQQMPAATAPPVTVREMEQGVSRTLGGGSPSSADRPR
jgi:outer membrane lipoprotein SlyB